MEEVKKEEVVVESNPTPNVEVKNDNQLNQIFEELNKLNNSQKVLKDEIIKLKNSNVQVVETQEKPHVVNDKLWKEIF